MSISFELKEEFFRCYDCKNYLTSSIFQHPNRNQLYCETCTNKFKNDDLEKPLRDIFLENIVSKYIKNCPNNENFQVSAISDDMNYIDKNVKIEYNNTTGNLCSISLKIRQGINITFDNIAAKNSDKW